MWEAIKTKKTLLLKLKTLWKHEDLTAAAGGNSTLLCYASLPMDSWVPEDASLLHDHVSLGAERGSQFSQCMHYSERKPKMALTVQGLVVTHYTVVFITDPSVSQDSFGQIRTCQACLVQPAYISNRGYLKMRQHFYQYFKKYSNISAMPEKFHVQDKQQLIKLLGSTTSTVSQNSSLSLLL